MSLTYTPVDGETNWVYSNNPVQYLYMKCYVTVNKPVLSYQGEGPPVCYDVKYMDCTAHGIGASKFPLLQQENLTIELLRAV